MMRRLTMYLGLAFAACMACFSPAAFAEPLRAVSYHLAAMTEPQDVAMQRLELTLAMWRTGSQSTDGGLASNLRASSNHFVMTSAKPGIEEYEGLAPA
ncbi:hypothetical protein AB4P95_20150 [Pseudomonas sp. A1437]|uniref:hypothetical protein n=1 Tax=unclassified Pseudomonas TaxID=196821 RepID=UPI003784ECD5